MKGLVIIDGPDATGKTTLARQLLNGDDAGYIHLTYNPNWKDPDRTLCQKQRAALRCAVERLKQNKITVIDRHWLSEQIYARVYRGGTTMDRQARIWDAVIQRFQGVYVICAPIPASAWQRHRKTILERSEMYKSDDKILKVADRYRSLWFGQHTTAVRDYAEFLSVKGMCERSDAMLYDIDIDGGCLDKVVNQVSSMSNLK
jgi:thymidylate kinase